MTDDAARASAIMEAVEYAVAEKPDVAERFASANDLTDSGDWVFDPTRFLPLGENFDRSKTIGWFAGRGVVTHRPIRVPADVVRLNGTAVHLKGVCQTTNGLASGNTEAEAVFHGLCELVERDANTMWLLQSATEQARSVVDPDAFDDEDVNWLTSRIRASGMNLCLCIQPGVAGVSIVMALIADRRAGRRRFDLAAGYSAHPNPAVAALRALAEAAQTRITSIAGARDDIEHQAHADAMNPALLHLFDIEPMSELPATRLQELEWAGRPVRYVADCLMNENCAEPIVVPLSSSSDYSVVRVLSADLEDYEANLNWRPGRRALAMLNLR